jgi:hypothetical protein
MVFSASKVGSVERVFSGITVISSDRADVKASNRRIPQESKRDVSEQRLGDGWDKTHRWSGH